MPEEQSDERRLSQQERLALEYERLDKLPPVSKPEEAFKQLATTLDEVEDEFSGVPRNPDPGLKFDGRMYPPREDFTALAAVLPVRAEVPARPDLERVDLAGIGFPR